MAGGILKVDPINQLIVNKLDEILVDQLDNRLFFESGSAASSAGDATIIDTIINAGEEFLIENITVHTTFNSANVTDVAVGDENQTGPATGGNPSIFEFSGGTLNSVTLPVGGGKISFIGRLIVVVKTAGASGTTFVTVAYRKA